MRYLMLASPFIFDQLFFSNTKGIYMTNQVYLCLIVICCMIVLDIIWISSMRYWYSILVRQVQGNDINVSLLPACVSYICVFLGIWYFSIPLVQSSIHDKTSNMNIFKLCLLYGGGLGFITYGIFNFTNMAIFHGYTHWIAWVDIMWGITLGTLVTYTYFVARSM